MLLQMFSGEFIPIFYLKVDFIRIVGFQAVIIALKNMLQDLLLEIYVMYYEIM